MTPTEKEMFDQIDLANEGIEEGGKFNGMSYEEGVKATLEWVMGQVKEKPMDE